jgi:hypothetical protein
MVTERNNEGAESGVEITDLPVDLSEPSTETPTPIEAEEPTPVDDSIETTENSDNSIQVESQSESQSEPPSNAAVDLKSMPEFRKYQSVTDKRMAELENQVQEAKLERAKAEEQANLNNLNDQVAKYTNDLRQRYINQGLDDVQAQQMASEQSALAKEAYLAKMEANNIAKKLKDNEGKLNGQVGLARAYELSAQLGVPFSELQDIRDPQMMEKHAKSLYRIKQLEEKYKQVVPAQDMANSSPSPDVAPTDAEDVIDRYNSGDPNVTTDMARTAAKKLGLSIFG